MPTRRDLLKFSLALPFASQLLSQPAYAQQGGLRGEIWEGLESVDAFLAQFVRNNRLRGAGIVIVRQDKLVYARTTGYALSTENRSLEADTLVPIGSITKHLAALGVMKLVQDGKLELDEPFLPLLPAALVAGVPIADPRWQEITVRQLLQMCAGIPEDLTAMWKVRDQLKSRRDAYKMMFARVLTYSPDTDQMYNNCNFSILGDVIENIAGQKWRAFILQEILQPIGIMQLPAFDEIGFKDGSTDSNWNSGSEGVACMNLLDLAKLVCQFSKGDSPFPLSLETRLRMLQLPPPPLKRNADGSVQMGYYGLGLMSVGWEGEKSTFAHGGALVNAQSFFVRHTDGSIHVGFFCGALPSDTSGNGQWTMCGDLLKVTQRIQNWPEGREF